MVKGDDGLPARQVGIWSKDKLHFLARYLDAFTTSMRKKWKALHYIDGFAGPGRCKIKESGEFRDGSPIIAARTRYPFTRLHLCDKDRSCIDALSARIAALGLSDSTEFRCGDANVEIPKIVESIPQRDTLSLAFLDPTGLHLHFDTLAAIATRQVDLILFFPDRIDALRNWERYYYVDSNSNLDRVLGPDCDWRTALRSAPNHQHPEILRKLYEQQLEKLEYLHRDYQRISFEQRPYYILIFCSKHPLGAELWRKTTQKHADGQRDFDFSE